MTQSVFDPNIFKQMTWTEANSTESIPIPIGEWNFEVTKWDVMSLSNKEGTENYLKLQLMLTTSDPEVVKVTGRDKNTVRYELFLDVTDDGRGLDFGKGMNVQLGRARAAAGVNDPGKPFSFDQFMGRSIRAGIKHRTLEDKRVVADITGVALPAGTPGAAPAGGYTPPTATSSAPAPAPAPAPMMAPPSGYQPPSYAGEKAA